MLFKTRKTLISVLFILSAILVYFFFWPRKYDVLPPAPPDNLNYWELSTGSHIAYTVIAGEKPLQATPILYLHGGPGGFITQEIIDLLRPLALDGYTVYLYDQIGSGQSERLDNISEYTVDRHLQDLDAIIKVIGAEQVILMGQSWGAMLATAYLTAHCEQVFKAIFTGPGPILPVDTRLAKTKAPDSLGLIKPSISNADGNRKVYHSRAKFIQKMAYYFGVKIASDSEVDQFFTVLNNELKKSTVCDPSTVKSSVGGGGYYAHTMTLKSFYGYRNQREQLSECPVPLLVVKGQCDNQAWGYGKEYLDLLENAELSIIRKAGHSFNSEQTEQFNAIVKGFLHEKK